MKTDELSKIVLILIALFSLSACVSIDVKGFYTAQNNGSNIIERPPIDVARVVFFRPNQKAFNSYWMINIIDGDKSIGVLPGNSYFVYDAEPGEHIFGGAFGIIPMDFLRSDIEGGKTYYVRAAYLDKFFKQIVRIIPMKPGTDKMKNKDEIFQSLQAVEYSELGRNSFTVQQTDLGSAFDYELGGRDMRVNIEQRRNEWLANENQLARPMLLSEDGE